ncbi:T9SS type A sorting domain-containing protein [Gaetbulibacter sp. M240]|uniref:T9SS type A sorting domain-containing protein n=1 Tax=Gaetbulibacter sp. M240 TaxID=3126511 RepID=UPI00374E7D50
MKKITISFLFLTTFFLSFGQENIPITNGDMESSTAMTTSDNKNYFIDGFSILENTPDDIFDEANSGLAPGEGQGGSQALKSTIQNSIGETSNAVLGVSPVDISANGPGNYTFSVFMKTTSAPTIRPVWMVVVAFDEDMANVNSATRTIIDNGGTITWQDLGTGYIEATVSVSIRANTSGGKDAKFLVLRVQHAGENNTYYFDNITLTGPEATLSVNELKKIGVSMYPNPAHSLSSIKSESQLENISLYSITGKQIFNKEVDSKEFQFDVSAYAKGLYLLKITNSKGSSTSKLVIK